MSEALYGESGFYLAGGGPGRHFRTAGHVQAPWAGAIHRLARRVADGLGSPAAFSLVDVGAGGGELLAALADLVPPHWSLVGVDPAQRPPGLPDRVEWQPEPPDAVVGLIVAVELLDVVPIDVAVRGRDGVRLVTVSPGGEESAGELVTGRDAQWLATWWPTAEIGDRAELGWPRDDAWRALTSRLTRGAAVAVDYPARPLRDTGGTLTAYRDGRQVAAIPDGRRDLTAHVLFESLCTDGDVVLSQRAALQSLGVLGRQPRYDGDPAGYLAGLAAAGDAAELLDPDGLGDFTWLVHCVDVEPPL